jgi:hypothetical protein
LLAVEFHWVVPEENITHGAVETTVLLLKHPMLLAVFAFGRHSSL